MKEHASQGCPKTWLRAGVRSDIATSREASREGMSPPSWDVETADPHQTVPSRLMSVAARCEADQHY
eukprot:9652318-Alexandrium_andersonii.AAC.1